MIMITSLIPYSSPSFIISTELLNVISFRIARVVTVTASVIISIMLPLTARMSSMIVSVITGFSFIIITIVAMVSTITVTVSVTLLLSLTFTLTFALAFTFMFTLTLQIPFFWYVNPFLYFGYENPVIFRSPACHSSAVSR